MTSKLQIEETFLLGLILEPTNRNMGKSGLTSGGGGIHELQDAGASVHAHEE